MTTLSLIALGFLGQAATDADDPAARLAYMNRVLERYDVHSADAPRATYRLRRDPVCRFTNPVGKSRDGAVFLWLADDGRPGAAVQISLSRDGHWFHDVSSLSDRLIALELGGDVLWSPRRGGMEFKPVPGAPSPATSPEKRLRQLRTLAAGFAIEDNFQAEGWQKLRMFSTPLTRYGKAGTDVVDGALYTFVLTTDPEAFLAIEARPTDSGLQWQYGLAPMTIYPLRASLGGAELWSVPHRPSRSATNGPTEPFYGMGAPRGL